MDDSKEGAIAAQAWLARLLGSRPIETAQLGGSFAPALAALAAEAMARQRRLLVVSRDDQWLAAISNAMDLNLRPLCLVLPAAEPAPPRSGSTSTSISRCSSRTKARDPVVAEKPADPRRQ
jgi:hypothetical protein